MADRKSSRNQSSGNLGYNLQKGPHSQHTNSYFNRRQDDDSDDDILDLSDPSSK